jgi:tRNA 2-thiouridine synthesizing protein A
VTPDGKRDQQEDLMANLIDRELDLRGLKEPVPVRQTRRALHDMLAGDVLMVTTSDHDTVDDFHTYCERSGHTLLLAVEEDDTCTFLLRKHGGRVNGRAGRLSPVLKAG